MFGKDYDERQITPNTKKKNRKKKPQKKMQNDILKPEICLDEKYFNISFHSNI
jgi:hypothetical protein